MRDIATRVGVRPSAIYNHYPSKAALLQGLMLAHMERVVHEMGAALADATDPAGRLVIFARYHLLLHMDFPDDVFLAYSEIRSLIGEARDEVQALRDRYEGFLRDIIASGKSGGQFTTGDADVQARAIIAMLTGVTTWYREGGPLSRADVIDTYVRAVVQSCGLTYQPSNEAG